MVYFFQSNTTKYFFVQTDAKLNNSDLKKLRWLFGKSEIIDSNVLSGKFIGPRKEMITPWSTNAVEITQNMGINGILRIEEMYLTTEKYPSHDPMLQQIYNVVNQD